MPQDTVSTPGPALETQDPHIHYRADIDGLRAVAVGGVLIYHAFPDLLSGGFVGVDIFFVISGYLITLVILDGVNRSRFSISDFYARRVRRIFPALFLVLCACLAFGWKTQLAEEFAQLGKHTAAGAGFVANLVLWNEAGYFDSASASKPLLHLWSLGIEEQFYLAWPLMLWVAWRARLPLMPLIAGTAAVSFAINLHHQVGNPTAAFYSPLSRAWELMIGGMLAHWSSASGARERAWWSRNLAAMGIDPAHKSRHALRTAGSVLGMGMLAFSLTWITSEMAFPGVLALLPTVGTALLIASGPSTLISKGVLASRPFVWVGLISYPLYLWHWPLLTLSRNAFGTLNNAERAGLLLASLLLAWLTWRLVELPMRRPAWRSWTVGALLSGMTAVAAFGITVWKKEGFPSRYPEIIKRATEYDLDTYRQALRYQVCFVEPGTTAEHYASECVDPGQNPLWVLWGDSGAAALYAGLRDLQAGSGKMRLAQFTSSSCPPLPDFDGPNPECSFNNAWTLQKIAQLKPDTVLLAAMWNDYNNTGLPDTIAHLRSMGVRRIVLLGQPPSWKETPSRIVFNIWRADPLHQTPGKRLEYATHGRVQGIAADGGDSFPDLPAESFLREVAATTGTEYISLTDVLCNKQGCLTRADSESGESFYLDIVHLTPSGSRYTINLVSDKLLNQMN